MRRSNSTKTTPRNDGLPTVNGRKVGRRRRFGSENDDGGVSRSNGSHDSFWPVFLTLVVIAVTILVKSGNHKAVVEFGLGLQEQASTKWSTQWATAIGPESAEIAKSADIVQLKGSAIDKAPVQTKTEPASPVTSSATSSATSSSAGGNVSPEKCTAEQLALVSKQLPEHHFQVRPWHMVNIVVATTKSSYAYNPILMREFYASDQFKLHNLHTFFGIVVGWQNDDVPADLLAIGSRDARFDTKSWNAKLNRQGLPPVAINSAAGIRPARVLVVNWDQPRRAQPPVPFQSLADSFPLSKPGDKVAAELMMETIKPETINDDKAFFGLIKSKMPNKDGVVYDDQPIHYLDITASNGQDIAIMKGFIPYIKNVRYIHFEYNKEGSWESPERKKLSAVINDLKSIGMVCYFTGTRENDYDLWRITDCFLEYYEHHHYANIACVSAVHDDVKELAVRMEKKFLETLKKDQKFVLSF